jgi:hypothetical protein
MMRTLRDEVEDFIKRHGEYVIVPDTHGRLQIFADGAMLERSQLGPRMEEPPTYDRATLDGRRRRYARLRLDLAESALARLSALVEGEKRGAALLPGSSFAWAERDLGPTPPAGEFGRLLPEPALARLRELVAERRAALESLDREFAKLRGVAV